MGGTRTVRKILEGKPEGRKKKGKPSLKWTDDAGTDQRNMQ